MQLHRRKDSRLRPDADHLLPISASCPEPGLRKVSGTSPMAPMRNAALRRRRGILYVHSLDGRRHAMFELTGLLLHASQIPQLSSPYKRIEIEADWWQ